MVATIQDNIKSTNEICNQNATLIFKLNMAISKGYIRDDDIARSMIAGHELAIKQNVDHINNLINEK